MTTRHLYLDIDGVLNTHQPSLGHNPWGAHLDPAPLITYAPALIDEVNDLIAGVENLRVFWLTSWEDEAPDFGATVGLNGARDWPWLSAAGYHRGEDWEKFLSIRNHIRQTSPDQVVWCDDELALEGTARNWATKAGILTIAPSNVLTPEHLQQIRDYFAD